MLFVELTKPEVWLYIERDLLKPLARLDFTRDQRE